MRKFLSISLPTILFDQWVTCLKYVFAPVCAGYASFAHPLTPSLLPEALRAYVRNSCTPINRQLHVDHPPSRSCLFRCHNGLNIGLLVALDAYPPLISVHMFPRKSSWVTDICGSHMPWHLIDCTENAAVPIKQSLQPVDALDPVLQCV